jgi:hypothetical protein
VPVPYRKRIGHSKISGTLTGTFKAGYKILWTIARYGLLARKSTRGVHSDTLVRATRIGNG